LLDPPVNVSPRWVRQARRMILTEGGLHFAKDGDHWRCVEHPDLAMLRGGRYRAGEREYGSL
jgi:hypothetical protein